MGLEDTSAPIDTAPASPAEPPPPPAVDEEARAREAARGRARRAKAREKALKATGVAPAGELEAQPAAPAAIVKAASPERIAQLAATLNKSLADSSAMGSGAIDQFFKDDTSVPVDMARATCAALADDATRKRLCDAWAPLLAELFPGDGPPSPYVAAAFGTAGFAFAVGATTFMIRKARAEQKASSS